MTKNLFAIGLLAMVAFASCSKDDDNVVEPEVIRGDVQLTENFEGNAVSTPVNYKGWSTTNVKGTINWQTKEYNKNKYAEVTAFNLAAGDYESWFVSTALNVTGAKNKNVTFDVAYGYWNDNTTLEVYVMTDSLPSKGNPVKLTATLPTKENVEFGFYNSGLIDLSKYSGKIYIGFKYVAKVADDKKAATFRVENFRFSYEAVKGDAVTNPLSVAEVLTTQDKSIKWVKGFIVGFAVSGTGATTIKTTGFAAADVTNVVLAPTANEKDITKCIAVKLLKGAPQTNLGLGTNAALLNTEISVKGVLNSYFGQPGMTDVAEFKK